MNRDGLPEGAADQLAVLADLSRRLEAAGIAVWLRGGWAIDFLVGGVTRVHADIDLVVQRADRRMLQTLAGDGYRVTEEREVQWDLTSNGVDVSFVFIERSRDGSVGVPGIPSWGWLAGALEEPTRSLEGVTFRPLSAAQLLDEKQQYKRGTGRPLRAKDVESVGVLRHILGDETR